MKEREEVHIDTPDIEVVVTDVTSDKVQTKIRSGVKLQFKVTKSDQMQVTFYSQVVIGKLDIN